ncbi:hypothetical protein WJX84_000287 [Apatococcus fuscideae]|uniref:Cilia- and flagella-associated protein 45 n=1 Tax=Apatococcus fuscideae TaxID=2026836 RepID=A0AAW1T6T9_9CHLO
MAVTDTASIGQSRRNPRTSYRAISRNSHIDESLFCSAKAGAKIRLPFNRPGKYGACELPSEDTTKRGLIPAGRSMGSLGESFVLLRSDLERMKQGPAYLTPEEAAAKRKAAEAKREQEQAISAQRKQKMLQMEEERKKREPLSETQQIQQRRNDAVLRNAEAMLLEEKDEVKNMNQIIMYGKCVTIRDAQINEKKYMMREEEEAERSSDLAMELDRQRAVAAYEEREQLKEEERRYGAQILSEQIEERKIQRLLQEEQVEQERLQMTKEIARIKELDRKGVEDKVRRAAIMAGEVEKINSAQVERKRAVAEREILEDAMIAEYVRQRDLREQALAEQKAAAAKEKELETARLRAKQERAADRQAEIDELRARRYQEAHDRGIRAKELADRLRAAETNRDLAEARESQQAARLRAQAEMATIEAAEFARVLAENKKAEQLRLTQAEAAAEVRQRHMDELRTQIAANEESRKHEHEEQVQAGIAARAKIAREMALIESIRQQKLKEMEADGIPAKYRAELARKNFGKERL